MKAIARFVKFIIFMIVIVAIFICSIVIYQGYNLYKEKVTEMSLEQKVENIRKKEGYVYYKDIPNTFINALVSIEDRRFFSHKGIDIQSILRAFINNLEKKEIAQGGSTITQQLSKNMYFTQEKKFSRKAAEVFTAFKLEENYSKEDILELYINIIYFGDGYYGIYEASQGYFNKEPKELTLYEVTLLAGLPNAPSAYALSNETELSKQRQHMVIDAMVENNCLTELEAKELKNN